MHFENDRELHYDWRIPESGGRVTVLLGDPRSRAELLAAILRYGRSPVQSRWSVRVTVPSVRDFLEGLMDQIHLHLDDRTLFCFMDPDEDGAILSLDGRQICKIMKRKHTEEILFGGLLRSFYQPIIDIETEEVHGYELLLRVGSGKKRTLLDTQSFFNDARRLGLLEHLCYRSRQVGMDALFQIPKHAKAFINVSPSSFHLGARGIMETAKFILHSGVEPSRIVFEITESEQIKNPTELAGMTDTLQRDGFQIALDDMGKGYSTLEVMIAVRPDYVKLDRSLVANLHLHTMKQSLVEALGRVASESGIKTIAEGVEHRDELDILRSLGVPLAQGFYFGVPESEPTMPRDYRDLSIGVI